MPTFLFNMNVEKLLEKLQKEIEDEIVTVGLDLLDISFSRGILKLTIDKPEGVTLDDCVNVNRRVGILLDAIDVIEGSYRLEVSSPGITRKLSTVKDYEHFYGKKVRIQTAKGEIRGILRETDGLNIKIETESLEQVILLKDVIKANLNY
jgi:ribosome maturation factor RimP